MLVIIRPVKWTAKYHSQFSSTSMCGTSSQGADSCISSFRKRWTTVRATFAKVSTGNTADGSFWGPAAHRYGRTLWVMTNIKRKIFASARIWTTDPPHSSQVLWPLSYWGSHSNQGRNLSHIHSSQDSQFGNILYSLFLESNPILWVYLVGNYYT